MRQKSDNSDFANRGVKGTFLTLKAFGGMKNGIFPFCGALKRPILQRGRALWFLFGDLGRFKLPQGFQNAVWVPFVARCKMGD